MNITEAVKTACQEPTLLDALTWICVWESERAINQARFNLGSGSDRAGWNAGWDTCFRICIEHVMKNYQFDTGKESLTCLLMRKQRYTS